MVGARLRPQSLAQALSLEQQGRLREAFDAYLSMVDTADFGALARSHFGHFLAANTPAHPHADIDTVLEAAITHPWVRPDTLAQAISRYIDAKWPGVTSRPLPDDPPAFFENPAIAGLLQDTLLLSFLTATPAATPRLEIFLARSRHAVLVCATNGLDVSPLVPFLSALGQRAVITDFALTLPDTPEDRDHRRYEPELVSGVKERIVENLPRPDSTLVALLATYEPLTALSGDLVCDPILGELVAAHVDRPAGEARIAASLTPATRMRPETDVVRRQYEDFPYPLWVREPTGLPPQVPKPVQGFLRKHGGYRPRTVLVAGCGTGQHAIAAGERWPHAEILAIDYSRASLAYAIHKADEHGFRNIRFELADILHVEDLGRRFDVIEATGVLHHLASPGAGLLALRRVLNAGGVLQLGLYSRRARQRLDAARRLSPSSHGRSAQELRAFRAAALADSSFNEVVYSPDFYSLGGLKDLVFHEREHNFDLIEVGAFLAEAGLTFVCLEPPLAAERLSRVPEVDDLMGWDLAEREQPLLFGNMYNVWAAQERASGSG
jgi:SAM-dependent methyltransferase